MRDYLYSGSGFGRAEQCPAHSALPWVDAPSVRSAEGTALHEFVRLVGGGLSREHALALTPVEVRGWAAKIDCDALPKGLVECSMAYDPATGLARFTGDHARRYRVEPGEIPMTPDLIVVAGEDGSDGALAEGFDVTTAAWDWVRYACVVDFKSTRHDHDPYYDLPQLEINGLAVARAVGVEAVDWAVGVLDPEGRIAYTRGTFDAARLRDVAARVRRTAGRCTAAAAERDAERVAGREYVPDVGRGPFCRFCPAALHCPATRAILRAAAQFGTQMAEVEPGAAYTRVQAIEKWSEAAREIIKRVVETHGAQETGDGRAVTLDSRGRLKLERVA